MIYQQRLHSEVLNDKISAKSGSYKDYIEKIDDITERSDYSYQERVLNYVKVGLGGQNFNIDGMDLEFHSDGTNSHKYLELFLSLIIALTRREFVTPSVYIDEPEIGLHPKRNEELIYRLHEIYFLYKKSEEGNMVFRRSLYAVKDIAEGERFTTKNVKSIRPGYGLKPKYLNQIIGCQSLKNIQAGTPISFNFIKSNN